MTPKPVRRRSDLQSQPELLAILAALAGSSKRMTIRDIVQVVDSVEVTVRQRMDRLEMLAAVKGMKFTSPFFADASATGREVTSMQYQITQHGRDILAGGSTSGSLPTPAVNSVFQLGAFLNR